MTDSPKARGAPAKPYPMRLFARNTRVRVYMGSGWEQGTVVHSCRESCSVYIARRKKEVRVMDARNVLPL